MFAPQIDKHRTFMGRLVHSLLFLTDSRTTVYSVESAAWFDAHGRYKRHAHHQC